MRLKHFLQNDPRGSGIINDKRCLTHRSHLPACPDISWIGAMIAQRADCTREFSVEWDSGGIPKKETAIPEVFGLVHIIRPM
jgi:hypothetical protein